MYDRKIGASMREQKKLACQLEIKSLDAEGRFAGYASVFGVLDNQKDIILRGAFACTIRGRVPQIKLLWQHQPDEPIGVFNAIFEDKRGLYVEGRLLLEVERAREAFALLKSGAVTGLSIGYSPVRYTIDPDTGVRRLAEVELWEVSLVTFPANEQAAVTVVKSAAGRKYARGELLRLSISAGRQMEELWEHHEECFAGPGYAPLSNDAIIIEAKSAGAGCDWITAYSTLLQIKMHADALLALHRKDDDSGDDDGFDGDDLDDDSGDDFSDFSDSENGDDSDDGTDFEPTGQGADDSGQTPSYEDIQVPQSWADPDAGNFENHYEDHAGDFGASSWDDYADQANQFYQKYQDEDLPAIQYPNGGETGVYDPDSNTFGVYAPDGLTQTFYKPTSPAYFQRETDDALSRGGSIINPLPDEAAGGGSGGDGAPIGRLDLMHPFDPLNNDDEQD